MKRALVLTALLAPVFAGATGYIPNEPMQTPAEAFAGFTFAGELGAGQFSTKETRRDVVVSTTDIITNINNSFGSIIGFNGTLYLAYLYPVSCNWLVGIDGFGNFPFGTEYFKFNQTNASTLENTYLKYQLNWQAGIEGQVAYAVDDDSSLAFSIGAAWSQWKANGSFTNTATPAVTVNASQTTTNVGLTIAGTAEQSVFGESWENLRLIEQYRLVFSPNVSFTRPVATTIATTGLTTDQLSSNVAQTLTVGLAYTFNL